MLPMTEGVASEVSFNAAPPASSGDPEDDSSRRCDAPGPPITQTGDCAAEAEPTAIVAIMLNRRRIR